MLARPNLSIDTWKKSSSDRSPRPAIPQVVPLLQMSPRWMTRELLFLIGPPGGVGPGVAVLVWAGLSGANAPALWVPPSPGSGGKSEFARGAPAEPAGPPP